MKCKLLKRLRRVGRNKIDVYSITRHGDTVTGMGYAFTGEEYSDLFELGMTEDEVRDKAARIYIENELPHLRKKYKK